MQDIHSSGTFKFVMLRSKDFFRALRVMCRSGVRGFTRISGLGIKTTVVIGKALMTAPRTGRPFRVRTARVSMRKTSTPSCPLRGGERDLRCLEAVARLEPEAGAFRTMFHMHSLYTCTVRGFFRRENFICIRAPLVAKDSYRNTKRVFRMAALSPGGVPLARSKDISCSRSFFKGRAGLAMDKRLGKRACTRTFHGVCAFKPAFHTRGSGAAHRTTRF